MNENESIATQELLDPMKILDNIVVSQPHYDIPNLSLSKESLIDNIVISQPYYDIPNLTSPLRLSEEILLNLQNENLKQNFFQFHCESCGHSKSIDQEQSNQETEQSKNNIRKVLGSKDMEQISSLPLEIIEKICDYVNITVMRCVALDCLLYNSLVLADNAEQSNFYNNPQQSRPDVIIMQWYPEWHNQELIGEEAPQDLI